jgi:hypothetical protein
MVLHSWLFPEEAGIEPTRLFRLSSFAAEGVTIQAASRQSMSSS